MFIKEPNESFKIAFHTQNDALIPQDFSVFIKSLDDYLLIPHDIQVKNIKNKDYCLENISLSELGEYIVGVEAKNVSLRALVKIEYKKKKGYEVSFDDVSVNSVKLPDVSFDGVDIPTVSLPDVILPSVDLPNASLPNVEIKGD